MNNKVWRGWKIDAVKQTTLSKDISTNIKTIIAVWHFKNKTYIDDCTEKHDNYNKVACWSHGMKQLTLFYFIGTFKWFWP